MSKIQKNVRNKPLKSKGDHEKYISRITKTLYYGKLPKTDRLSLPVTELAAELFSESQHGKSLDRLHCNDAASISRNACVSPCSLVLAVLYLERLKLTNAEYLEKTSPSDLFLVSLMISSKFLYDDGEGDEVFIDEWARSAGKTNQQLKQLEKEFLKAISWEVFVNELTFWKKLNEIETELAKRQGIARGGYFTYTELQYLLETVELHNIFQCFVTVSVVLTASYIAALLTMIGSVFIVSNIPGSCLYSKKINDNQYINTNTVVLPLINFENKFNSNLMNDDENFDLFFDQTNDHHSSSSIINDCKLTKKESTNGGALKVLKTGLFLASIESFLKPFCNQSDTSNELIDFEDDTNVQNITWDWWSIPIMNWLSQTSELIDNFQMPFLLHFNYFFETWIINTKQIELDDHIQKATKTRIQDQLESSWHEEWSDTIKLYFFYSQNIKTT